jgi:thiopeptide-type bacteriocin biosynthesis protein
MTTAADWVYLKLYLSAQAERADALLADLGGRMRANPHLERWFFLRFLDEQGFHIRLRALPKVGEQEEATRRLSDDCADVLDRIYDYLSSTYQPMVRLPEYMEAEAPPATGRVHFVSDVYAPEHDKFGNGRGMETAERVFHLSSEVAQRVLADEGANRYSRKSIAPFLLEAAREAFPSIAPGDFWSQYSLYWLGGDSPAAQDWRDRFLRKGAELEAQGIDPLDPTGLVGEARAVVADWRAGLAAAATAYERLPAGERGRADVLSLNFAHLMMNRIGVATLEESYLAALLEARERVPA